MLLNETAEDVEMVNNIPYMDKKRALYYLQKQAMP